MSIHLIDVKELIITPWNNLLEPIISFYYKISKWIIKPIKKGLIGFLVILGIIIVANIIIKNSILLDYMDASLAGLGFFLKFSKDIVDNFNK